MLGRSKRIQRTLALAELSVAVTLAGATMGCGDSSTSAGAWAGVRPDANQDGGAAGAPSSAPDSGGANAGDAGAGHTNGGNGGNPTPSQPDAGDPVPISNDPGPAGTGNGAGGGNGAGPQANDGPGALARGITISQIALYQGVKIPLMSDGTAVTPLNAPIVKNRPGLLRVFVEPAGGFSPRDIIATLAVTGGSAKNVTLHVTQASTDDDLATTFDFDLSAADLSKDISYSVSLHEKGGSTSADPAGGAGAPDDPGAVEGATWPATGTATVSPQSSGEGIDIVFVPFEYGGDGSQRLPDTSDTQLEFLSQKMFATYPVAKVNYTLHKPLSYGYTVNAQNGWSGALNALCVLRKNDAAPVNAYYYGLIAPAASVDSYCGSGCVTGIAVLSEGVSDTMRCAMGLGYENRASGVFLQEVAHNHGRQHAPCGSVSQVDQGFPYPGAKIGDWGYDMVGKELVDPSETVDFMSYCSPVWISDYTYSALFKRIGAVNQLAGGNDSTDIATDVGTGRVITVETDGALYWGDAIRRTSSAEGRGVEVSLRDASGSVTTVRAQYQAHSQGQGAMLVIPEMDKSRIAAVKLPGQDFRPIGH